MLQTMHDILQKVGDNVIGTIYRGGTAIKNTVLVNPQIVYAMDGSGSITFDCPDEIQMYDYIYTDGNYFLVIERTNNTWRALWIPQLLNHIIVTDGYGFEFPFTDTYLSDILTFLNGILDRPYNKLFQKFTITTDLTDVRMTLTFSKDTIATALEQIVDILNCFVVYDNFNIKLTASLEQNSTALTRGKNCVVVREHENGLIPTRVFTLGSSENLPPEYRHTTLTKAMANAHYTLSQLFYGLPSLTSYRESDAYRDVFWLFNWAKEDDYIDVILSAPLPNPLNEQNPQYLKLSVYDGSGNELIRRAQVLEIVPSNVFGPELHIALTDELGRSTDIDLNLSSGVIILVESTGNITTPSEYEDEKKVSIQKFIDIPASIPTYIVPRSRLLSMPDPGEYRYYEITADVQGLCWEGNFMCLPGFVHLKTFTLQTTIYVSPKSTAGSYMTQAYIDVDRLLTDGTKITFALDDIIDIELPASYAWWQYRKQADVLEKMALQSMQRPLKEYDLVLTGSSNFKAGQMATFEGGQYLVQQVQKTVDKTTIKLSTKPYDVYLRQFLNIYDTQRNMQREYRRK